MAPALQPAKFSLAQSIGSDHEDLRGHVLLQTPALGFRPRYRTAHKLTPNGFR